METVLTEKGTLYVGDIGKERHSGHKNLPELIRQKIIRARNPALRCVPSYAVIKKADNLSDIFILGNDVECEFRPNGTRVISLP